MQIRFDSSAIASHEKLPDGRLRIRASVSRVGALKYMRSDGSIQEEIVTADELFRSDSLDSAGLAPVTLGHPSVGLVTPQNYKTYAVGSTGSKVVARQDSGLIDLVFVVADADAIVAVESGSARQVSAGYQTKVVKGDDGNFYQTDRVYNHFAIVPQGRAGSTVALHMDVNDYAIQVDSSDRPEISQTVPLSVVAMPPEKLLTLKIDEATSIELDPAIHAPIAARFKADAATIESLKAQLDEATKNVLVTVEPGAEDAAIGKATKKKLDELRYESIDALVAELDTQTGRADQFKAEVEILKSSRADADVSALVKSRVSLEKRADALLPKDFNLDEATDRQIMEAAIANSSTLKKFDGLSDDYLTARFDAIVEIKGDRTVESRVASHAATEPRVDEVETARLEYIARLQGAK